jgi:hypothetical protein
MTQSLASAALNDAMAVHRKEPLGARDRSMDEIQVQLHDVRGFTPMQRLLRLQTRWSESLHFGGSESSV